MEGKSLVRYFKKFSSVQNKALINYKLLKEDVNEKIMDFERKHKKNSKTNSPRGSVKKVDL